MKIFKSCFLVIALIFLIESCSKAPSQFYDSLPGNIRIADHGLFSKALTHQKKGQIEVAIELWEKILRKYPNSFEARNNLGLLYYANDEITHAIIQFEQGINQELKPVKIKDNLVRALKVRVAILEENKKFELAITDLKRIAQLSPIEEREKIERRVESCEDKIFDQVKKSNLLEEYQEFLEKYPNSPKNSDDARSWIQKFQKTTETKKEDQFISPEVLRPEESLDIIGSSNEDLNEIVEESVELEKKPIFDTVIKKPMKDTTLSTKMVEVIKPKVINVHSEPKIKSENIVYQLKTGAQVVYADENEGWYQIEFANGKLGWVIKKYTKILE